MLTTNPIYAYSRGRAQNSNTSGLTAPIDFFAGFFISTLKGRECEEYPNNSACLVSRFELPTPYGIREQSSQKGILDMNNQLVFKSHTLTPVIVNNQPYLRGQQIAVALNYNRDDIVAQLYNNHADEFTPDMSFLTTVETSGGKQQARVFSLRGCHLLAMFSKTPVAKEFRRWVLDLIEQRNQTISETAPASLDAKTLGGVVKRCAAAAVRDELETLPELVKAQVEQTVYEVLSKVFYPGITEHPSGMPFGNWAVAAMQAIGAMTSEYDNLKQKQQAVINLLQDKENKQ